jgi:hypothetical protein
MTIIAKLFYGVYIGENIEYDLSQWTEDEAEELEEGEYLFPDEWQTYIYKKRGLDLDWVDCQEYLKGLNVELITSIGYDSPFYSFGITESIVECDWEIKEVDVTKVQNPDYEKWDNQLKEFFNLLGIKNKMEVPKWHMSVFYSH